VGRGYPAQHEFFSQPDGDPEREKMVEQAARGLPIHLASQDPNEAHDILYAKDAARAVLLLLHKPTLTHQVYNLGAGRLTTLKEFAAAIQQFLNHAYEQLVLRE
jgi:nucleoside-diphosphate-sugar epimerase